MENEIKLEIFDIMVTNILTELACIYADLNCDEIDCDPEAIMPALNDAEFDREEGINKVWEDACESTAFGDMEYWRETYDLSWEEVAKVINDNKEKITKQVLGLFN